MLWYGPGGGRLTATARDDELYLDGEPLMPVSEVPLPGSHMLRDVLAAAVGARLAGATPQAIANAIRELGAYGIG